MEPRTALRAGRGLSAKRPGVKQESSISLERSPSWARVRPPFSVEKHKRASGYDRTQEKAIKRAKQIAENLGVGAVRIRGADGKFRDADTKKGPKYEESKAPDLRAGNRKKEGRDKGAEKRNPTPPAAV